MSSHPKFVVVGTLVSWVPYMLVIALLAQRVGPRKAIGLGLGTFFVLATAFVVLVRRFRWFE